MQSSRTSKVNPPAIPAIFNPYNLIQLFLTSRYKGALSAANPYSGTVNWSEAKVHSARPSWVDTTGWLPRVIIDKKLLIPQTNSVERATKNPKPKRSTASPCSEWETLPHHSEELKKTRSLILETYTSAVFMCNWPIQSKTEFNIHRGTLLLQVSHFFPPQSIQYFQKKISLHTVDSRKWYAFVSLSSHLITNYKCTTSTHAISKRGIHPSHPRASKPQRGEPHTETDDGCEKQPLDGRFCKNCAAPAIAKPPTTHRTAPLFLFNSPPPLFLPLSNSAAPS